MPAQPAVDGLITVAVTKQKEVDRQLSTEAVSSAVPPDPIRHDVFISYATIASGRIGAALENGLATFGRAWDAPAALDVFRDVSDQPATMDLARDLLRHLDGSQWFVLLASPAAAASRWVQKEVEHWLTTRGTDHLIIVLVDGELTWDASVGSFDNQRSSALVPVLLEALRVVPKWVDLRWTMAPEFDADDERFFDAVADLSAAVRGIRKEELISAHWQEYGRGLSRRLAQQSTLAVENDTELALLLAAAAVDIDACPENSRALADVLDVTASIVATVACQGEVSCITAAPDGESLLVGSTDGVLQTWQPSSGSVIHRRCPREARVSALAQSLEHAVVAIGYADGIILVVDGDSQRSTSIGDLPVTAVAVTVDGRQIAASTGRDLTIWDIEQDHLTPVTTPFIHVAALRANAAGVRVYDRSGWILVDPATGAVRSEGRLPTLPRQGPRDIDITGEFAVQAQLDGGGVTTFRISSTQPTDINFFQGPPGLADAVAIAPGAESVAFATGGQMIFWHQNEPDRSTVDRPATPNGLDTLVLGRGGSWVALKGSARTELRTRSPVSLARVVPVPAVSVASVIQAAISADFTPSGDMLAWVTNPSTTQFQDSPSVSTWKVDTFQAGPTLSLGSAGEVSFLDDRRVLVTQLHNNTRLIWDLATDTRSTAPAPDPIHRGPIHEVDGQRHLVLVKKDNGEVLDSVDYGPTPTAVSVRIGDSGRLLAVATAAGRLLVRDIHAQQTLWTAPTPWLTDLAFSPNWDLLATVTASGRLLLLDVATAQLVARFSAAPSALHRLVFAQGGRHLAVAGIGGLMTLINIDTTDWRGQARRRAGRTLTHEEVAAFGLDRIYLTGLTIAGNARSHHARPS